MGIDTMIDTIFGGKLFDGIVGILTHNTDAIWLTLATLYKSTMIPIGSALLVLYFLIELMEQTTHDNFNIEHFFRMFIKLLLGSLLINNGLVILQDLQAFGNSICNSMIDSKISLGGLSPEALAVFHAQADSLAWYKAPLLWVQLAIPFLMDFVIQILVQVICYSRLIEIVVRAMFAPLALPDVFAEGTRGGGFKYLKKYFATCLQGAIILGICIAMATLSASYLPIDTNGLSDINKIPYTYYLQTVTLGFATASLVMKSKEWANDVVGV